MRRPIAKRHAVDVVARAVAPGGYLLVSDVVHSPVVERALWARWLGRATGSLRDKKESLRSVTGGVGADRQHGLAYDHDVPRLLISRMQQSAVSRWLRQFMRNAIAPRRPATIVHVLGTADVHGTAHARTVELLARHLDPDRFRLVAWFLGEAGPLLDALQKVDVAVRRVPFTGGLKRGEIAGLRSAIRADHPDLFHLHTGGRILVGVLRMSCTAPVVFHIHGASTENNRPLRPPLSLVHASIAVSEDVAARVHPGAVVVRGAVEIPSFLCGEAGRHPVIGSMSRFEPIKGLGDLLEAFSLLAARFPDARLELAGSGTQEAPLRARCKSLGLEDRIEFLGWREDREVLLRRWAVVVQPSLDEGLGLTVLEGMAYGLPVVASAVGGITESVLHEETGYLVSPGDAPALARAVGLLLAEPDRARAFGRAGRTRAEVYFSAARMASETAAVYDRVLAGSRDRPRAMPAAELHFRAMWPTWIKRLAGPPVAFVLRAILRLSEVKAGIVLVYHRLDSQQGSSAAEFSPAIAEGVARRQLQHLRGCYEVVPLERFFRAVASRRRGQRFPVSISFDDDSREQVERAKPLLRSLGLPAAFSWAVRTRGVSASRGGKPPTGHFVPD